MAPAGVQVPAEAVSVSVRLAVPAMPGAPTLRGRSVATLPVAAVVAVAEPKALVAVTTTRSGKPRSSTVGV